MQKLINEVEYTDVETMEKIRSTISKYELEDDVIDKINMEIEERVKKA